MQHVIFVRVHYTRIVVWRHMHGFTILHIVELIQYYQTPFALFYATHKNFASDF